MKPLRVALVGNPNCGKSTLFNQLTGSRQKVGNWPGVTVSCNTGHFSVSEHKIQAVDLPGVYSMTAVEEEGAVDQRLACDHLLETQTDVIINVVDASNLERQLYLTTQLLELGCPVIIALNMVDIAKRRGLLTNLQALQRELSCKVVSIVASRGEGLNELKKVIIQAKLEKRNWTLDYPPSINHAINILVANGAHQIEAVRLLEEDAPSTRQASSNVLTVLQEQQALIKKECNEDADIVLADVRFTYVHGLCQKVTQKVARQDTGFSSFIDRIVLNRILGIPIFLGVMYALFFFAINIGGVFQDFFDITTQAIFVDGFRALLTYCGSPAWLTAVLANGAGKGINTAMTFIPVIGSMFFFLSLLETSGYMARATFVVDRVMRALGLPGQAFIPLIVGFGCNVPGIIATRHLESRRDRILTILMSPFMSCSARLAIFAVFTTAFFPSGGHNIVFALYVIGIAIALLTGFILRHTLLKGQASPLLLELPAYHLPRIGSLFASTWVRLKHFIYRAAKIIVPVCMVVGVLNSLTINGQLVVNAAEQTSILAIIGRGLTPLFSPIGISHDNWPATVGLLTGGMAKEVVVGTLNSLYSQVGHLNNAVKEFNLFDSLYSAVKSIPLNLRDLPSAFVNPLVASAPEQNISSGVYGLMYRSFSGPVAAFSYLLFVLLYTPCVSTVAAINRELNKSWMWFSIAWSLLLAYGTALLFYQLATFVQHPLSSSVWICGYLLCLLVFILLMNRYGKKKDSFPYFSSEAVVQ